MTRVQFFKILFLVTYWVIAAAFIISFEGIALGFKPAADLVTEGMNYNFPILLITGIFFTFFVGSLMAVFEVLYLSNVLRKKPLGIALFVKTLFYLTNIFFWSSLVTLIFYSYSLDKSLFDAPVLELFYKYLSSPRVFMNMAWWGFTILMSLFILQVSDKFGKGVLLNFILGKYHKPKEEERIFMFLDLTSATTIAEKIGPHKYSSFLKDFFFDLEDAIYKTKGAVFQYVGDEVVIIWDIKKGIEDNNCIRLFFLAEEKIKTAKNNYLERYGVCPKFKAGLHFGKVIITEVGGSKSDIAYHGDTINTAARIRSVCHNYSKRLLLSADLLSLLHDLDKDFSVKSIGVIQLKGKENIISLFSVENKN